MLNTLIGCMDVFQPILLQTTMKHFYCEKMIQHLLGLIFFHTILQCLDIMLPRLHCGLHISLQSGKLFGKNLDRDFLTGFTLEKDIWYEPNHKLRTGQ